MSVSQPQPWEVRLRTTTGDSTTYDTIHISAVSVEDATEQAEETFGNGWEAYDAMRLCVACDAAPHEPCEAYGELFIVDPERVPLGETYENHLVPVPLCPEHMESIQAFMRG